MFDSAILDVAVGLVAIYLILSLVVSAAGEKWAAITRMRASILRQGIAHLVGRPETRKMRRAGEHFVRLIYAHPRICSLGQSFEGHSELQGTCDRLLRRMLGCAPLQAEPAYIPPSEFAKAFLDEVLTGRTGERLSIADLRAALESPPPEAGGSPQDEVLRAGIDPIRRELLMLLDEAQDEAAALEKATTAWFNRSMERVSGWYRRRTQLVIGIIATLVVVAFNADSVKMATDLYAERGQRAALVSLAEGLGASTATAGETGDATKTLDQLMAYTVDIPFGWTQAEWSRLTDSSTVTSDRPAEQVLVSRWLAKLFGWIVTILAISQGAPFWFDILRRVTEVRSSKALQLVTASAESAARPS